MARTPEQIAADEALTVALAQCASAYGMMDDTSMLGDWIVSAEVLMFDEEGRGKTRFLQLMPDSGLPHHRALGLLEVCQMELRRQDYWEGD